MNRSRLFAGIAPIVRMWKLAWWRWALREIDPMHPDVGLIVRRVNELERAV
jgi:hypothetical protein